MGLEGPNDHLGGATYRMHDGRNWPQQDTEVPNSHHTYLLIPYRARKRTEAHAPSCSATAGTVLRRKGRPTEHDRKTATARSLTTGGAADRRTSRERATTSTR